MGEIIELADRMTILDDALRASSKRVFGPPGTAARLGISPQRSNRKSGY
jgi:hypothetical protein